MQASRFRVEFIRFGLLVVVTIGLLSVAARAFDDADGRPAASGARPSATAPGTSSTPDADATRTGDSSTDPSDGSTPTPGGGDSTGGDSTGGDGTDTGGVSGGGGSGGTGDGAIAAPELPRTGPDTAIRLTGFALVLIAGGALSLTGARRSA